MKTDLNPRWLYLVAFLIAAVVVYKAATRTVDFPVYYQTARALIEGRGPLYGPGSGLGWPSYFRYPPLFLLLFAPFALLPLKISAGIWAALKCVVLYFLVRSISQRLQYPRSAVAWLIPTLLVGAILVEELRYGNAQLFVFALVAAAVLDSRTRRWRSALALALAISLKAWPLFFVPYLAARREWRLATGTLVLVAGMTLLPAAYFNWQENEALLRQWAAQERDTASAAGAIWYPSQSLRGVLTRYLTAIDYSKLPDKNYRNVNLLAVDPRIVGWVWLLLAAAGYCGLLIITSARARPPGWTEAALAFCGLALLEPFTHKIGLVVLLWPAMVAGAGVARPGALPNWSRRAIYVAAAVLGLEPLVPGAQSQRLFQVVGVDFFATCLLTAALLGAWLAEGETVERSAPRPLAQR